MPSTYLNHENPTIMTSKKFIIITSLFTSLLLYSFAPTCYTQWLSSYEAATETYTYNQQQCGDVAFGWDLCNNENELAYDQALEDAGEEFHCCVLGC